MFMHTFRRLLAAACHSRPMAPRSRGKAAPSGFPQGLRGALSLPGLLLALAGAAGAQATTLDVYDTTDPQNYILIGQIETIRTAQTGAAHYSYFSASGHPSGVNLAARASNIWIHEELDANQASTGQLSFGFIFNKDSTTGAANMASLNFRIVDSGTPTFVARSDDSGEAVESPAGSAAYVGNFNYGNNTDGIVVSGLTGSSWTVIIASVDFGNVTRWSAANGTTPTFEDDLNLQAGHEYRVTPAGNPPSGLPVFACLSLYDTTDPANVVTVGNFQTIKTQQTGAEHYSFSSASGHPSGVNLAALASNVWVHEQLNASGVTTGEFTFGFIFDQENGTSTANDASVNFRIVNSATPTYVSQSDDAGEAVETPAGSAAYLGQFSYRNNTDGIAVSGLTGSGWTVIIDAVNFGDVTSWRVANGVDDSFTDDIPLALGHEYRIAPCGAVPALDPVIAVTPPVADAGDDQSALEGAFVALNGSGSQDTNDPPLTISYAWTQVSGPSVTMAGADSATPTFTAPPVPSLGATLTFRLVVTNGVAAAVEDTVVVTVSNDNVPPVAVAGADQTVNEGEVVLIDGRGSSDADEQSLTFHWEQVAGPTVVLTPVGAQADQVTFVAPEVGPLGETVVVSLSVTDGLLSDSDEVSISVLNVNVEPVANAGPDLTVNENDNVTLDGSASSDVDGDTLSHAWSQVAGPAVVLSGASSSNASFVAPEVAAGGATLTFQLDVSDGVAPSVTDWVDVRINNVNHAPLADAGADLTVPESEQVSLDGSGSMDGDGDSLTYTWEQTLGTTVLMDDPTAASVSFTAPDVGAEGEVLEFSLRVDDPHGATDTDVVRVQVTYLNRSPSADAGAAQAVSEGATASQTGSASDPDGNMLTIQWTQVSGPAVALLNDQTLTVSFAAPAVTREEADVVLRMLASDAYGGSASDEVTIRVANVNRPPTAEAPTNMSVPEESPVSLIGQAVDPDSEEQGDLVYQWVQTAGPAVVLGGSGANVDFTAPIVTAGGDPEARETLTFELTVTDPNGASDTDTVDVVVANVDHSPIAVAGANLSVNEASHVMLNGSASSDPDGDALSYSWQQTSGPPVTLTDVDTPFPAFTAPFVSAAGASLEFELTVDDGFGGTSSSTTSVTVGNVNDPPVVAGARASEATLWPPNHKMVRISILGVVDPERNATIQISSVTQDEPTQGLGDGDTPVDAILNADGSVLVRAERAGNGNGRVYHVHFTASDFEGSVAGVVLVGVPHSKSGSAAVDGGELHDSTGQ